MPATDQYWRNLNSMHKVFLGSTLLFAAASLWMIAKDSNREWRDYQVAAEQLRLAQARTQIANIEADPAYQKELAVIEAEIAAADAQLASEADQAEEARLLAEIDRLTGDYTRAARRAKFERAGVDKDRSLFDIDYRDSRPEEVLDGSLQSFMDAQVVAGLLSTEEQVVKAELDQAKGALAELNKARDDAIARKVKLNLEKSRLQSQIELIDPTNPVANFKRTLKDQQVIDSFNPTHKIQFDWPQRQGQYIKVQLGMASVNRVDRCRSCHIHITEFGAGNVPNFPKGTGDDGGYSEPFCSHPNPDLYLSSTSPHKVEEFGCTVCHGGDGSGTSFQNAEHTPSNPGQAQHWANDFGWHSNHFWEYPMLSKQFVESSCLKCHHQVMELGVNEKFGASAPKLFEGYNTLSKYGCFGCHPVNGFNGSHQIGPDLRLEPQTAAEALAIANDPNQVAGQMRKVGPSLRHVSQKSPTTFLANWTAKPSDFRPNTPMPLFFDLANQQDHLAMALQPVELVAISKYLEAKSTPIELLEPKEGYVPDVERGKQALAKSGCLACHTHDDEYFKGIQQDFGPNLTRVHEKINPGKEGFNWLYTWLREPTRHHPRTKMPNLYLEGVQQGDEYIDPAADIAQFLLDGGPREFKQIELPGVYLGVVTESTDRGLEVTEILAGGPTQQAQQVNANGEPALSSKAPVVSSVWVMSSPRSMVLRSARWKSSPQRSKTLKSGERFR
ncbi:MAG: c-type cytochrome [Planctomycetaceae bacterium]